MGKTKDKYLAERKQDCIIVDIDGTLAYMVDRTPYQYHKAINDGVYYHIRDIVNKYADDGYVVVVVSGRDAECEDVTTAWLDKMEISYSALFMRPKGDRRCDSIVKKEIYEKHIEPYLNVFFVLDDRDKVVKMWRDLGLNCLQVAYGNF